MERRTYESPMDWEYQTHGPMDPSSPFVQSARRAQQQKDVFASSSNTFGGALGQTNPLSRIQSIQSTQSSTPSNSKNLPGGTPSQPSSSSIFATTSTSHSHNTNRTTTAPPFRNPAFTTPRRPFDVDAISEASPAESSPTATDNSDFGETPDNNNNNSRNDGRSYHHLDQMTITPASMRKNSNKNLLLFPKKQQSGKGEIMHTVFSSRDKVRKRKRFNDNKDISGYRLPYRQPDEWDETDYDSDESTTDPSRTVPRHGGGGSSTSRSRRRRSPRAPKDGWLGNFLSVIQRHPHAPAIMTYWLTTLFNFVVVSGVLYLLWTTWSGFRDDLLLAHRKAKDGILAEIQRCTASYQQNRCHPVEQRLPAIHQLCEDWYECMIQNENGTKTINTVVLELVEMLNTAIGMMHWKTLAVMGIFLLMVLYSGVSLVKNAGTASDYLRPPPAPPATPYPSSAVYHPTDRIAWEQIAPQTPSRFHPRHHHQLLHNDETPETDDASPPPRSAFRALAPGTPSSSSFLRSGGSPVKMLGERERERERQWERERGRSPTKSRSPVKRY